MKQVHIVTMDDRYYDAGGVCNLSSYEDKAEAEAIAARLNEIVAKRGKRPVPDHKVIRDTFKERDDWDAALNAKLDAVLEGASNCEIDHVDYQVEALPFVRKHIP